MMSEDGIEIDEAESYTDSVFGDLSKFEKPKSELRSDFSPWHHPVKQFVRRLQWGALTADLIKNRQNEDRHTLRYFTLPGQDLMDIQEISSALKPFGTTIEFFGFDASRRRGNDNLNTDSIEASLRQSGKIAATSLVMPDDVEDISEDKSQAAEGLRRRQPFDVVNLDACNHLAHVPEGRTRSLFNALEQLLAHQMMARTPWLLFVTTRVDPEFLGAPADSFKEAIGRNLHQHRDGFLPVLADCLDLPLENLEESLDGLWQQYDFPLLKIYSIGFVKHILHLFHAQGNLQSSVRLKSVYSYRVSTQARDMLSFAIEITPKRFRINPPAAAAQAIGDVIELRDAKKAVIQVKKMWDLDEALSQDNWHQTIVDSSKSLMISSGYSIPAYIEWVKNHPNRPVDIS